MSTAPEPNQKATPTRQESSPAPEPKATSSASAPLGGAGAKAEKSGPSFQIRNLNLFYGDFKALQDISMVIPPRQVTAFIGPSGCGKSSYLRCLNRMNDLIDVARIEGEVLLDGQNIYDPTVDVPELRRKVGMVFQKPNPFPKSIYENVAYGLRLQGVRGKAVLDEVVERALRSAAIWDEVKDRLNEHANALSGGQQQRLVIARAVAIEPEVILLDEPCSALDPIATAKVEQLMIELKERFTIVVVTHNMQQASRVSDNTAFFYMGDLIEMGETASLFTNPEKEQTEAYISGRFG